MNRLCSLISVVLLACISLLTSSCNKDKSNNFTIACLNDAEPFGYIDASGNLTGFEIELINAIAMDQDVKIKLKPMDFEEILSELKKKNPKIDGAISLITWTAARREFYDFSYSYLSSGIAVAVKGGRDDIHSLDDLAGKSVSVKKGSYIEEYAMSESELVGFTVKSFLTTDEAFNAVTSSQADAIMEEYPLIEYRIGKGIDIDLAYSGILNQDLSLAIKVGAKSKLLTIFNYGLQNIKENGTYDSILKKYFPFY